MEEEQTIEDIDHRSSSKCKQGYDIIDIELFFFSFLSEDVVIFLKCRVEVESLEVPRAVFRYQKGSVREKMQSSSISETGKVIAILR